MSAQKARFIRRITKNGSVVSVNLKDTDGRYVDVDLFSLSRVELIRAASMLGIKSGGTWTTWANEEIRAAIEKAVVTEGKGHDYADTEKAKGEQRQPEKGDGDGEGEGDGESSEDGESDGEGEGEGQPDEAPGTEAEAQRHAEQQQQQDNDDPLLAALRKFVKDNGIGKVTPEDVKDAVDEAVKDLKPHVTTIKLPDGGIKDVPGRQHEMFDLLLKCISARLNCYLVGPPGTGKSYSTNKVAEALDLNYASLSLGPQTPESRLWGYYDAHGNYVRTPFRDAYEFGWVFCLDELDNGHPGIIATMNQAIAGDGATFPDGWIDKHEDFVLVATANTFGTGPTAEFVGRNILDAATLDRFTTIEFDIDKKVEADMIAARLDDKEMATKWHKVLLAIRKNATTYRIKVVASPRSAADGAALLAMGIPMEQALDMRVFRGLGADQKGKLLEGVQL